MTSQPRHGDKGDNKGGREGKRAEAVKNEDAVASVGGSVSVRGNTSFQTDGAFVVIREKDSTQQTTMDAFSEIHLSTPSRNS